MEDKRQEVIETLKEKVCPICGSETHFYGECASYEDREDELYKYTHR